MTINTTVAIALALFPAFHRAKTKTSFANASCWDEFFVKHNHRKVKSVQKKGVQQLRICLTQDCGSHGKTNSCKEVLQTASIVGKKTCVTIFSSGGEEEGNRACVHRFFVTLYGLKVNVVLKFNSWLIMRVIVSLICTFSDKSLQNRCYFFAFFEGRQARSEWARETRDEGRRSTPALYYRLPEKREKIAPIPQAIIGNYKIPLVFCRAIEEYVSKVTSRLVGWLKSAGTSSITAATLKTPKETLYKTRSNSRHWLNRFPPKPGYGEAICHSNN